MATWQPERGPARWGSPSSPDRRVRGLTQAALFHARKRRLARHAAQNAPAGEGLQFDVTAANIGGTNIGFIRPGTGSISDGGEFTWQGQTYRIDRLLSLPGSGVVTLHIENVTSGANAPPPEDLIEQLVIPTAGGDVSIDFSTADVSSLVVGAERQWSIFSTTAWEQPDDSGETYTVTFTLKEEVALPEFSPTESQYDVLVAVADLTGGQIGYSDSGNGSPSPPYPNDDGGSVSGSGVTFGFIEVAANAWILFAIYYEGTSWVVKFEENVPLSDFEGVIIETQEGRIGLAAADATRVVEPGDLLTTYTWTNIDQGWGAEDAGENRSVEVYAPPLGI